MNYSINSIKTDLFNFDNKLLEKGESALRITRSKREEIRKRLFFNQQKVLRAFIEEEVGEHHFYGSTGYGFSDMGRECLDRVYARIFGCEAGLVRWQIVSGTHALSSILLGNLRPGDHLLIVTGDPYDTLKPVMKGLEEWGIAISLVALDEKGNPHIENIIKNIKDTTKMVLIQRSRGYSWRYSLRVSEIKDIISIIKSKKPDVIVMVDNCYGELVESEEPTQVGADIMGGSLIKNMGGAIAPTGGYVVGKQALVEKASHSLTCPGVGGDEGSTLGISRLLFQGTFFAPQIVANALEGSVWSSCLLEMLGFDVSPRWYEERSDIIQAIALGSIKAQEVFCRGIQKASPVDARAIPEGVDMPGYQDKILMAGGTFIQGSSIELSCDGPMRPPYAVYLQGGISFAHIQLGVYQAVSEMNRERLISL